MPKLLRATILLAAAGVLGLVAFRSCAQDPPPVKRIVARDEGGIALDVKQARRSLARHVPTEVREAWTQVVGTPLEIELVASGRARLGTAALLLFPAEAAPPTDAAVRFELRWENVGEAPLTLVRRVPAADAGRAWTALELDARAALATRTTLVLTATAEGTLPPGTRVAWQVPEIEGYAGTALSADYARPPADSPNVLFISVDTLRPDHLGCYGYARDTSPHIDALAAKSVLFEDAVSSAPWTLPSYGSVFTGLDPSKHWAGAVYPRESCFGQDAAGPTSGKTAQPLTESAVTLAQHLARAGWQTAGFVNNRFLSPSYGLDRGFQRYVVYEHTAEFGVELAQQWIEARDRPWFCFLHLMDTHMPYAPPEPWDAKFATRPLSHSERANWMPPLGEIRGIEHPDEQFKAEVIAYYDGALAWTDHNLGRLLAALEARGALANTIVVFHSDHGEEFWDHGGFEHGHTLYQELLHVPLFLRYDGRLAPARVRERVRAYDLFPTILELCGQPVPAGLDAQSLLPWLAEPAARAPRDARAEFMLWSEREFKARYQGALKLIAGGARHTELFDLSVDPRELQDLSGAQAARSATLRAELVDSHRAAWARRPRSVTVKLTAGEVRAQVDVGYGDGSSTSAHDECKDP